MVQIRQLSRVLKYAGLGGAGLVIGGVMTTSDSGMSSSLASSSRSLLAKSKTTAVNVMTPESKTVMWDNNWDKRNELFLFYQTSNVMSKGTIEFSEAPEGECDR